jgi:hypothetical protein
MSGTPVPQIICVGGPQDSSCTPLPIPPFVPSQNQPPNNVLVIPRQTAQQPSPCDLPAAIERASQLYNNLGSGVFPTHCAPISHLKTFDCGAEVEGCDLDSVGFGGGVCSAAVGTLVPGGGIFYDSDPNFLAKVNLGIYCPDSGLSIPNPLEILPPVVSVAACHDGSAPSLAPCGPGQCLEGNIGCCPCDPPLPYGGSGPIVEGSQNSTEGYWTSAPAPLGLPTPELFEDDPVARIAPDIQPVYAPLKIPLPTSSIASTACNSCSGDAPEIDELDA